MIVPNFWSRTILLALNGAVLPFAAAAERIPATYCVTVSVTIEESDALASRLDGFALNAGLTFEAGDPGGRYYVNADESAMIALRNGMGEFGSILSYVPMETTASSDLPESLAHFVKAKIAPLYETTPCQDVAGFSMPEVRR